MNTMRTWITGVGLFAGAALVPATADAASAADLTVSIQAPAGVLVEDVAHYVVQVKNVGNRNADGVVLTVDLPATHTSPGVFVLGDLSGVDPRCTRSAARLTCNLGRLNRASQTSVAFDLALPYASAPHAFVARGSTTSAENVLANNRADHVQPLTYYSESVPAPVDADITRCTGTALTSFFECTVYTGATQTFALSLDTGGIIRSVGTTTVVGQWAQPASDSLTMTLVNTSGNVAATFDGKGVGGGCFEGVTTFPLPSVYVSPYRVCF
ncbi:MAG: hypothetical protein RL385_2970 [Pseudomonadota bacterium]|jgi:hypothetical protein